MRAIVMVSMEGFDMVGSKIWFRTGEKDWVVGGVSRRQGIYDEWVSGDGDD